MSRELFVLRHANADVGGIAGQDSTRALSQRGRKDAQRIADWMREHYLYPGRVYCSTATRARETSEIIAGELELKSDCIEYQDDLYLASTPALLKLLKEISAEHNSVMLIGHNPGLQDLIGVITGSPMPRSNAGKLLSTACLVQLKLPDDWNELAGRAELVKVIRPSEIDD